MEKRRKIILVVVAVVALVLIIVFLLWWLNRQPVPGGINANQALLLENGLPAATLDLPAAAPSPVKAPDLDADLKAIAATFAERFGSYSTDGNFSNLETLNSLMTVKMKAFTDNLQAAGVGAKADYYGFTTKALAAKVLVFNESAGQAEILVTAQRQETVGNLANPRTFYQDLKLQLVKTGEGWKVDSAVWQ